MAKKSPPEVPGHRPIFGSSKDGTPVTTSSLLGVLSRTYNGTGTTVDSTVLKDGVGAAVHGATAGEIRRWLNSQNGDVDFSDAMRSGQYEPTKKDVEGRDTPPKKTSQGKEKIKPGLQPRRN